MQSLMGHSPDDRRLYDLGVEAKVILSNSLPPICFGFCRHIPKL